jgi:signal transduction histidine kinase
MTRRLPIGLIVPAALVVLVGALASLQYRWLGQVSEAERERLQTSLRQRAEEFADEFDREVLHMYVALQADTQAGQEADNEVFARRYDAWRSSAKYAEMLRALYLVEPEQPNMPLRRFASDTRAFVPAEWPDTLAPVRQRLLETQERQANLARGVVSGGGSVTWSQRTNEARHLVTLRSPIVASVPALLIGLPTVQQSIGKTDPKSLISVRLNSRFVIAELDRAFLENTLLPALAARHFPERGSDSYVFAILESEDAGRTVFARGVTKEAPLHRANADASVPFFSIRHELAPQILTHIMSMPGGTAWASDVVRIAPGTGTRSGSGATVNGRASAMFRESTFSILVQPSPRGAGASEAMNFAARPLPLAAWQLVIRHSAGSLDAAVGQARLRNLWLSFGILAVLAASVALIVVNARRSERLAAQQMDFVATVSHELRTPLAVIRSAAQNLSAGVIHEADQAKRYGDLIESEGRRLTDMVEQVLEYAGLGGARRPEVAKPVDVRAVVQEAAAAHAARLESDGFTVAIDIAADLPAVMGDEGALRRALDNLLSNAQKYGADGRWIGLSARRVAAAGREHGEEVQILVGDRGWGIESAELPHVFEPFYRGRRALDQQIHGNGLGLSLVKRIIEAHGGRVGVESVPGQGTTFTLHLPVK